MVALVLLCFGVGLWVIVFTLRLILWMFLCITCGFVWLEFGLQWLAFTWLWLWGWGLVDLFARACATCVGVGRLCSGFVGLVELRWLLV